jgi:hypothetical protein
MYKVFITETRMNYLTLVSLLSFVSLGTARPLPSQHEGSSSLPQNCVYWEVDAIPGSGILGNLSVGTPGQEIKRIPLDSASSDTWFSDALYSNTSSSTAEYVNSDFLNAYIDGSSSGGVFVKDQMSITDNVDINLQIGVGRANESDRDGIIGLSFPEYEFNVILNGSTPYPNFLKSMKEQGLIGRSAFSMYPSDGLERTDLEDSYHYGITFGGVDESKIDGELTTLPILYNTWFTKSDKPFTYFLQLDEIFFGDHSLTGPSNDDDILPDDSTLLMRNSTVALLDSGNQAILLPTDLLQQFNAFLEPIEYQDGQPVIPCDSQKLNGYLHFKFHGGYTASMKMSSIFFPIEDDTKCESYVYEASTVMNLGLPFLSNHYILFDQDAYEISFGKLKQNSNQQLKALEPFTESINPTTVTLDPLPSPTFPFATAVSSATPSNSTQKRCNK